MKRAAVAASALVLSVGAAVAPPAQACVTDTRRVIVEFAPGSSALDADDRAELAEAFAGARGWRLTVRGYADQAGDFTPYLWDEENVALAEARARSVMEAILSMGGPAPDETVAVGVAPTEAETRVGADGVTRYGRGLALLEPPVTPRVDDGTPVPTC